MLDFSTALKNQVLSTGSLKARLENASFKINLYNGTPPGSVENALSGNTLLAILSEDGTGTGLTFAASAANGALAKNASETWQCLGADVTSGTPTFYRLYITGEDPSTSSTTLVRIQGTAGLQGSDLNTGVALVATVTFTLGAFEIRVG